MKDLTLIVHADIEQALADVLRALPQVRDCIFAHVAAHGAQDDRDPTLSASDLVVGYTPHVRVDILLQDADVDVVLTALRERHIGVTGRGIYWVIPVKFGKL